MGLELLLRTGREPDRAVSEVLGDELPLRRRLPDRDVDDLAECRDLLEDAGRDGLRARDENEGRIALETYGEVPPPPPPPPPPL